MNWKAKDSKIKGVGRDIIYAREKFYLAHYDPNGVAYSEDLTNWQDVSIDSTKISVVAHIAYGNSRFLLTGYNSESDNNTYLAISSDGISWSYKKVETGKSFSMPSNTCKFINNKFVFLTGYYTYLNSTGVRTSTTIQIHNTQNGDTIKRYDFKYDGSKNVDAMDIAYGNGLYVLVGCTGSIFVSKNLKEWQEVNSGVTDKLVGVEFGKGKFVVTGANGVILTSTDGYIWTKQLTDTNSYLIRSRYANGLYLVTGYNGTLLSSLDGNTWTNELDPYTSGIYYGLTFANNNFVVTSSRLFSTKTIPILVSEVTRDVSYSDEDYALYIYDKNLNFLGVIDEFISLRWRRKYYKAGEFELVVAPYKNNLQLLSEKDRIIIRQNYTEAALIDTISMKDDGNNAELHVSGNFMSILLKRRIVKEKIIYSGNVIDGQKRLMYQMTPLTDKFEIESTTLDSDEITYQCSYKNIYEYACKLSQIGNIGFRIVPNIQNKVFRFENYKGLDRTKNQIINERYCFSKSNNNIEKTNCDDSLIDKCNYVLVGGTGEDEDRIFAEVNLDRARGFDLFESFIDAKNESNKDLTIEEYKNILRAKGLEKINSETKGIEATVIANDYKKKWDLGDIVDIVDEFWGIEEAQRIVEVEEIIENGKKTILPTFGQPLAEKISLE